MQYRLLLLLALTLPVWAQTGDCNEPAASPSVTVSLPGPPFMVASSHDGCWVFVSITGGRGSSGMAVLKRSGGHVELARVVPLESAPTGIVLTHDGKLLIAAATNTEVFLDVKKMTDGDPNPIAGSIGTGRNQASIYANVTADDKLLFISEEAAQSITVIDLEKARGEGYTDRSIIGKVPTGGAPIALTFSKDGKYLYTTAQSALPDWNWPKACKPEAANVPDTVITRPEGAIVVVDVEHARTDPAHAVVARVPAGCSPVRMAMSPDGGRIYVTARNSNAVVAFDTARLISDSAHAQIAMAPVGDAPVPVAVVDKGRKVITGNSNRFAAGDAPQKLVVLDAAKFADGLGAVAGVISAGAFPREMSVSTDGRTLFLTNFGSKSLQVLDIEHLPIDRKLPPEIAVNAAALAHRGEHKPMTLDPKLIQKYAGVYRAENGPTIVVAADGSGIKMRIDALPATPALPASETKFFVQPGWVVEFPGGTAAVDSVTLHADGVDKTAKRVDEVESKKVMDAAAVFDKRLQEQKSYPGSEAALRKIIADLKAGTPDQSMMTATGYLHEHLSDVQSQVAPMGVVESVEFQRVGPAGPDIYSVTTDKGLFVARIWMAADGKVESVIVQKMQQ